MIGSIDFSDTRFVDPEFAHLASPDSIGLLHPHGTHRAIPVAVNGWSTPVDKPIAEVVYLAWKLGFSTRGSCQESVWSREKLACVSFMDMNECQRFVKFLHDDRDYNTEVLDVGAWIEGGDLVGEVNFPLDEVPALVARLRSLLPEGAS